MRREVLLKVIPMLAFCISTNAPGNELWSSQITEQAPAAGASIKTAKRSFRSIEIQDGEPYTMQRFSIQTSKYAKTNDPVLRRVARPVNPQDFGSKAVQDLIDEIIHVAENESLLPVGLAAPQIGRSVQIIIINDIAFAETRPEDINPKQKRSFRVFINPTIRSSSIETATGMEGCFSALGLAGIVRRAKKVTVSAYDRDGNAVTLELEGFIARVFQHEIDHLYGIIYPDRIFRSSPASAELHHLFDVDDGPEVQQLRLAEYREKMKEWTKVHGSLEGFVWSNYVSKEQWEQKIVQSRPDWSNELVNE